MKKASNALLYGGMALGIILLVIIDQLTKGWAANTLAHGSRILVLKNVLDLVYVENRGAAFGIFQDTRWFLVGVTSIVVAGIVVFFIKQPKKHPMLICSGMLIVAGGIGNLIDRVANGYVVDFLNFLFIEFPCFNVADVCVSVGAGLLVLYILFFDKQDGKKPTKSNDEDE